MLTREEIIDSFVAEKEAIHAQYCELPLDDRSQWDEFALAKYRAWLEENLVYPVYKVCEDFHYLGLKCCVDICHAYHYDDLHRIKTPGGDPAYVCCAIRDGLDPVAAFKRSQEFFLSKDPKIVKFLDSFGRGYSRGCPGAVYDID